MKFTLIEQSTVTLMSIKYAKLFIKDTKEFGLNMIGGLEVTNMRYIYSPTESYFIILMVI